jgi:cobyrinic acid a,c-diamide synthase
MNPDRLDRLVIAGTHSGSGKTTISLALMTLLARQGHVVFPFKAGPDYIDPAFHQAATGRLSRNLDAWLLPDAVLRTLFLRHANPDGLALVEGVMGLFDGLDISARCSTAHVAALLEAPVILVVNGEGSSLSTAALVSGFASFKPRKQEGHGPDLMGLRLAGVILNRVSGPAHYDLLRRAVEEHTGIPCFGYLVKNSVPILARRHLGLLPAGEQADLRDALHRLADLALDSLDIPGLLEVARNAPPLGRENALTKTAGSLSSEKPSPVRLGVAKDAAFSFYYQDNLDMLEELGAELILCSPLKDDALPENLDGLYLGGGFPEVFAQELEDNLSFRQSLKAALDQGLPAFVECGGLLYLCAGLHVVPPGETALRRFAMTGFFSQEAEMTDRLQQPFGYVSVTLLQDCVLGRKGDGFRGHEFHYSRLREEPGREHPVHATPEPALRLDKPDGRTWSGGLCKNNVLAMYPHVHFHGCPDVARNFIHACRSWQRGTA